MAGENILREYPVRKGKGRAFIVNISPFDPHDKTNTLAWAIHERKFVERDTSELKAQFEACGYVVKEFKAHNKEAIETYLNGIKQVTQSQEYEDVDSLVMVFSGYGDEGTLFCPGGNVEINERLMLTFKGDVCPKLASKPKIFIMQTCNPPQYPFKGREMYDGDDQVMKKDTAEKTIFKIPAEANFVFIQCLIPGTTPWRKPGEGSMFLSNFCKHIRTSPAEGMDINHVMQRTRTDIDNEMDREAQKVYESTWKKLPLMSSTLTRKFRFKKQ